MTRSDTAPRTVEVEYVPAQLAVGDDPAVQAFAEVFEKFKVEAPAAASEEVRAGRTSAKPHREKEHCNTFHYD